MNKSASFPRIPQFHHSAGSVCHMITHKRTRCIGNRSRYLIFFYPIHDLLYGKIQKVCIRSLGINDLIYRLIPFIIRYSKIIHIDSYPLYTNICPASCLPHGKDYIRIILFYCLFYPVQSLPSNCRNLLLNNLHSQNFIRKPFDCLNRRIYTFSAKWIESCHKYLHICFFLSVISHKK